MYVVKKGEFDEVMYWVRNVKVAMVRNPVLFAGRLVMVLFGVLFLVGFLAGLLAD